MPGDAASSPTTAPYQSFRNRSRARKIEMRSAIVSHGRDRVLRACIAGLLVCSWAGCASGPPLPKRGAVEMATASVSGTDFHETVANADIIYFPSERAASGARSEPAALLLEALQGN